MKFNENDKIICKELKENQYYKLSAFDTSMMFWDCDLYENDIIIKHNIELNLENNKYVVN